MAWRLLVYNPDGSHRATIGPDDAAIDRVAWSLRGDGDCLDGVIVGNGLDLRARDIVAIQATPTPDGDVTDAEVLYLGWVVTVGDAEHHDLTEWRLVGGSTRLREVINRRGRHTGADLATMAQQVTTRLNSLGVPVSQLPPGLGFGSADRPTLGFELGHRDPHFETIGETLDALAAAAPGFVVQSGTTYAYDGVTYRPGDVVPAVTWGVRAGHETGEPSNIQGHMFFRRPRGALRLDELQDRLDVEREPAAADVVVDSVVVVVADRPTDNASETRGSGLEALEYEPIAYVLAGALDQPYNAWKRVEWQSLDAFTEADWLGSPTATAFDDAANAFDNDATSYATNTEWPNPSLAGTADVGAVAFKVRWSSHVDLRVSVARAGSITYVWNLGSTGGDQKEVLLVAPRIPAGFVVSPVVTLSCGGETEVVGGVPVPKLVPDDAVRIYDVRAYQLDTELLERVARSHLRPPPERVATVTVPNSLVPAQPRLELKLAGGQTVIASVATIEHAITREHGFTSIVRLGQELPAPLQAEKDLLAKRTEPKARPLRLPVVVS